MTIEHLLKNKAYIAGEWRDAVSGATFEVKNPSTSETIANVPDMGAAETDAAIDAAASAFEEWRQLTGKERSAILRRWLDLIMTEQEGLARLLTMEQGKPLAEARGEIAYGASFIEWFAEEAKRTYGETIPGHMRDKRLITIKQPVGVAAAITPWNFPSAMITRKAGAALAAGCSMIVKPAEQTPLSALALAALGEKAGLTPGVFSVITGDAATIGEAFTSSPVVRKLTFTGSTEIGRLLMRQSADTIKKVSLELGGNAPFVVLDDADLDKAADAAILCKFRNAGQTCVSANRIYVQAGVYDAFAEKLTARVARLSVGDGFADGVQIGPLIDDAAIEKVQAHLDDAAGKGAAVQFGGKRHDLGGRFFEPTVVTQATQEMRIASEETFGPLAPLIKFDTDDEAIALSNATEFGLAAYLFSNNISRAFRVAEAIETGMIGVNTGIISSEVAPFGGVKQSGLGREGGREGIEEFLETKYMCLEI